MARLLPFMEMLLQSTSSFFSNPIVPPIKRNDTMKRFILKHRIYTVKRTKNAIIYIS